MLSRFYPPPHGPELIRYDTASGAVLDTAYSEVGPVARRLLRETIKESGARDGMIDWSRGVDRENPAQMPDETIGIYGSPLWRRLSPAEQRELRRHSQSFIISQSFQGAQTTLLCAARLIQIAPIHDVKRYAALQAADDARHADLYKRLMSEFGLVYPPKSELRGLIRSALLLDRWDVLLLAVNVLLKNISVATIQLIRDMSAASVTRQVNAVVMLEQSRHAAFGREVLAGHFPELSEEQRKPAEDLLIDWSRGLFERLPLTTEVTEAFGHNADDTVPAQDASEIINMFRAVLFQRLVPNARAVGLWSPRVQDVFKELGVLHFAEIDLDTFLAADRRALAEVERELMEG